MVFNNIGIDSRITFSVIIYIFLELIKICQPEDFSFSVFFFKTASFCFNLSFNYWPSLITSWYLNRQKSGFFAPLIPTIATGFPGHLHI